MTTNTTQFVILDDVNGWRESALTKAGERLDLAPTGDRKLFALPGRSSLLLDADVQQQRFVCPSALSIRDNHVAVVDATTNQVSIVDPDRRSVETIATFGGKKSKSRGFRAPRGIALQKSEAIVVSDTANHRVLIFSETQHALVQSWGAVDRLGKPASGDGEKTFHFPWAVAADKCGVVYVVDRGNHRIQKIASDGTWLGEIGRHHLIEPTRIALARDGLIAVVDPPQQAVLIFSPLRSFPRALTNIQDVRSLTFDDEGRLYVADAHGLIEVYVLENDASTGERYSLVGQGHSGIEGEIVDLAWVSGSDRFLLAIIKESFNGLRQRLWRIEPAGTFKRDGRLVTTALDSRLEKCQWHRVSLSASMPVAPRWPNGSSSAKTDLGAGSIEIESYTSDEFHDDNWTPPERSWKRCVLSGDGNPDCLVQSGRGRFLWLRLTLRSNGIDTPVVKRIKAFFPRTSYLQYLPAVYQEDDESRLFLDRFLSIFQTEFDNFDQQIDRMWQLFDPASVSESHFDWLAGWLALVIQPESLVEQRKLQCRKENKCQPPSPCPEADDVRAIPKSASNLDWTLETKRQMLADAFKKYRERGTVHGIEQLIKDYTGVQFATIVEHFRLRRWPILSVVKQPDQELDNPCVAKPSPKKGSCGEVVNDYRITLPLDGTLRLWSRDFYKRLQLTSYSQIGSFRLTGVPEPVTDPLDWGAHRFTVFFPASPYDVDQTKQKVGQVVEREKPAHTQAELCPVLPRLRVGVQATVGADAMVGGISHLVLNSLSTLNYDSILACGNEEQQLRRLGTTRQPRAGMTARLS